MIKAEGPPLRPRTLAIRNPDTWRKIRHEYAELDVSGRVVARRYGISIATICRRAKLEGWRKCDMPDPCPPEIETPAPAQALTLVDPPMIRARGGPPTPRAWRDAGFNDAPPLVLRTPQRPPDDPWATWVFMGGRGAGKTLAGAAWLSGRALAPGGNEHRRLAIVGPTLHDVREVMVAGASGILSLPGQRPVWQASRRMLTWPTGVTAQGFSAEDPESLRGPQFEAAWCDELCVWRKPAETLALLRFGVRLGDAPRLMVTTTPRPGRVFRKLLAEPGCVTTRSTTEENAAHLAAGFLDQVRADALVWAVTELLLGVWRKGPRVGSG